jgi:serine/threonine protein kinase
MEEWSSEFILPEQSHTLQSYLNSLRCCIQHITFMHSHCFAHLDIAVRNVLTDYAGRYAYIDYETSRWFSQPPVEVEQGGDARNSILIYQPRATEIPPEVEKGHSTSPYAMDVWALGTLISKAATSTGYDVPELCLLTQGMLESRWERRPSAKTVLRRFEDAVLKISQERLNSVPLSFCALPTV